MAIPARSSHPTQRPLGREPQRGTILDLVLTLTSAMPYQLAHVIALTLLLTVFSGVSLLLLVPMLDVVGLNVGTGNLGALAELAAQLFALLGVTPTLPAVLLIYVAVMIATALLERIQNVASTTLYEQFVMQLRQRLYRAVTESSWLFFTKQRGSDFTHLLTTELERVGSTASSLLSLFIKAVLTLIYFGVALFVSPVMTLVVAASGLLLSLLLLPKTRLARLKGEGVSEAYRELYAAIQEHLSGMKVSKSHGIEEAQLELFRQRTDNTAARYLDLVRNQADVGFLLQIGSVTTLAAILYLALQVMQLPIAAVLLLIFLFARLIPMVTGLQRGYQNVINHLPAFKRFRDFEARCLAAAEGYDRSRAAYGLERAIRLERLAFSYEVEGGMHPTLRHLSLKIERGQTVAIVGPSGSGKSTLADLIIGLIAPDEGEIFIDDQPLTAEGRHAWRRQIGYVAQDTFMFHDTVRANLLVARPDASEDELREALRQAAADFVFTLPEGLDTVLGDRGVRLSGGERQRLALARALLRRPTLLVLDEATSALDTENEQRIQAAIDALRGKMTIVVIAHRLSTVKNADVIYVLEHGRLVESGDFSSLIRKPQGRFRALCQAQGLLE